MEIKINVLYLAIALGAILFCINLFALGVAVGESLGAR